MAFPSVVEFCVLVTNIILLVLMMYVISILRKLINGGYPRQTGVTEQTGPSGQTVSGVSDVSTNIRTTLPNQTAVVRKTPTNTPETDTHNEYSTNNT
mmetsp:Transcript_106867/g.130327  ORF Transcript_106867/g.130327 Transcript_106867/m.130327 type:complete len:97 (-) Transcript_106867:19-309(-)